MKRASYIACGLLSIAVSAALVVSEPAASKKDVVAHPLLFQDFPTPQIVEDMPNGESPQAGPTLLRTQLAVNRDISIFASYVRDFASLEARFNDNSEFSLVLAPSNAAISSLSSKPWEFPTPVSNDHNTPEEEKDRIARHNVMSFIAHHLNLVRSGDENDATSKDRILSTDDDEFHLLAESGDDLIVKRQSVESPDDKVFTVTIGSSDQESPIVVNVTQVKQVDNGAIWVLDGSLSRP
ncbi:hypothetical protein AWJ20_572 [Sugiyamaella lignohabitans]|uniref:FAS1 domain-containing protein n=1 Tax=Sugiyamaella lignohabitans TaxID=796027 RepID=A0A167D0B0_9ASCO|nr:uncharacterized protein AWJ20_572 [Sugiyamaella lignohabitans]ANB12322.1 hypothetical protein AWJ20_572 [Sugiyamaella lignohabitans]